MAEKVTIATVARRAQVSRQTVSNVLNAPHIVREETRRAGRGGHRGARLPRQPGRPPDAHRSVAGSSRCGSSRPATASTAGCSTASCTDSPRPPPSSGYRVMLYTARRAQDEIGTYEDLLAAYDLDAFVLTGTAPRRPPDRLADRARRAVRDVRPAVGRAARPARGSTSTAPPAPRQVTRHLIDAGHRRIASSAGRAGSGVGDDRRAGWCRDAGRRAGWRPDLDAPYPGRRRPGRGVRGRAAGTSTPRRPRSSAPATRSRSARLRAVGDHGAAVDRLRRHPGGAGRRAHQRQPAAARGRGALHGHARPPPGRRPAPARRRRCSWCRRS